MNKVNCYLQNWAFQMNLHFWTRKSFRELTF